MAFFFQSGVNFGGKSGILAICTQDTPPVNPDLPSSSSSSSSPRSTSSHADSNSIVVRWTENGLHGTSIEVPVLTIEIVTFASTRLQITSSSSPELSLTYESADFQALFIKILSRHALLTSSSHGIYTFSTPKWALLSSLASISRSARKAWRAIPMPVDPAQTSKITGTAKRSSASSGEYDSAHLYLARFARMVAEEGVKHAPAATGSSSLGVFRSTEKSKLIKPARNLDPISLSEWKAWFIPETGRLSLTELDVKASIFKRGLHRTARPHAWLFLLGFYPWHSNETERADILAAKKEEYTNLKATWKDNAEVFARSSVLEERRKIKVDCLRTDRTHPYFSDGIWQSLSSPAESESASDLDGDIKNKNVQQLAEVLLTYNFLEGDTYCQGMSDLCSPLLVVFDGDETQTFWTFVHLMQRFKRNFAVDQSGMRLQLSQLQQLIALIDPELYAHFESCNALNLFMTFRWILIAFKREFAFDDVLSLWETLFTDLYSPHFLLFIALAVLESHRDVIVKYLTEFDEILKYANDLSRSIDLESTISQAEVLFLTFQSAAQESETSETSAHISDELRSLLA